VAAPESSLPPLREIIARYGLRADKSLGQHYLTDLNLTRKIARAAGDLSASTVLEIGPGPGGLSRALAEAGCRRLILIEKDARFRPALEQIRAHFEVPVEIVHGDALEIDETALIKSDRPVKVVANLPYNVGSPLLVKWLCSDPWPPWYDSLTVMLQKEVVARLVAPPHSRTYGRLSVLAQWRARVTRLFDVPASAFVPPPNVVSSVVQLEPFVTPARAQISEMLQKLTQAAFGQRRKMLRSSLKTLIPNVDADLTALGIDPGLRAENLTVADYVRLAGHLYNTRREQT